MDRLFADMGVVKHAPLNTANPVDPEWNVAVRHIANKVCPNGWDEFPTFAEAPTTLADLTAYAKEHGRLGIATEDSEGTIFDCADTNVHLRAWHDSVHFRHQLAFNVAGEAAAVYVQCAQVFRVYGVNDRSIRFAQWLLADILGLVIHHKQTGKYPKNKRAGTVNAAPRWKALAIRLATSIDYADLGLDFEACALDAAKADWGSYTE